MCNPGLARYLTRDFVICPSSSPRAPGRWWAPRAGGTGGVWHATVTGRRCAGRWWGVGPSGWALIGSPRIGHGSGTRENQSRHRLTRCLLFPPPSGVTGANDLGHATVTAEICHRGRAVWGGQRERPPRAAVISGWPTLRAACASDQEHVHHAGCVLPEPFGRVQARQGHLHPLRRHRP